MPFIYRKTLKQFRLKAVNQQRTLKLALQGKARGKGGAVYTRALDRSVSSRGLNKTQARQRLTFLNQTIKAVPVFEHSGQRTPARIKLNSKAYYGVKKVLGLTHDNRQVNPNQTLRTIYSRLKQIQKDPSPYLKKTIPFSVYGYKDLKKGRIVYVGQTKRPITERFKRHLKTDTSGTIGSIIRKQGVKRFEVVKLAETRSASRLNTLEKKFIQKFRTTNPKIGYNKKIGNANTKVQSAQIAYLNTTIGKLKKSPNARKLKGVIGKLTTKLNKIRGLA